MRRFVKFVCICLALVITLALPVCAAEPRASYFFIGSSVYLNEITNITFDAWFDVTATGTMDVLGARAIKIQRSSDGTNWSTMKTFSMSDYSNLVCEDTITHAASIRYTGTKGYYYRACIELYAKNSSGTGIMTEYTSRIYLD